MDASALESPHLPSPASSLEILISAGQNRFLLASRHEGLQPALGRGQVVRTLRNMGRSRLLESPELRHPHSIEFIRWRLAREEEAIASFGSHESESASVGRRSFVDGQRLYGGGSWTQQGRGRGESPFSFSP